jgi:hypothetical protein
MRRALLTAGVFALLAMIYVPTPRYGYRFIFSQQDTSIALFQLLVNVAFAALAGAIVVNLSKRALYVIGACIAIVAVCLAVVAVLANAKDATGRAAGDEIYADRLLKWQERQYGQMDRVQLTEDHLHAAAYNWRLAFRFDESNRVEKRADEVAKMSATERQRINQGAEVPTYDSKGWTQESTRTTEAGPWLNQEPPGTRYYRDYKRIIYRVYPPGVRPGAEMVGRSL